MNETMKMLLIQLFHPVACGQVEGFPPGTVRVDAMETRRMQAVKELGMLGIVTMKEDENCRGLYYVSRRV